MRILIVIGLLLAGLGAIAYSYIGAFVTLAGDVERDLNGETPLSAVGKVLDLIVSGDIPQMTGFLYAGLLSIAIAVVTLFFGRSRNHDDADTV